MIQVGKSTPQGHIYFNKPIDEQNAPHEFQCPISRQIMKEPVITMDGFTFEKQAIQKWFKSKNTNPITNLKLQNRIIQNRALKQAILYHNQREAKANENAAKLVQKQYDYLNSTIPQLLDQFGLLDIDKVIRMSIENADLRKALSQIKDQIQKVSNNDKKLFKISSQKQQIKIQQHRQIEKPYICNTCLKFGINHQKLKNILKSSANILNSPPIVSKLNIEATTFQYLPISAQILKEIDFKSIRQKDFSLKVFKNYGIQNLPLSELIKRIRIVQKIPSDQVTRIWRVNIPLPEVFRKIQAQLQHQSCSYIQKVKQIGTRIVDLKPKLWQLNLLQKQFLIIQHYLPDQMLFRGNLTKCRYCYQKRQEKYKCQCQKATYCCLDCANSDKQYHLKQCQNIIIVPMNAKQ